jgi:plasmid stabilization system protein ParE
VQNKPYRDTFHPEALEEMLLAEGYYADISKALASDFYDELEKAVEFLREFAEAGQKIHERGVRKTTLKRFPYQLIYIHTNDEVFVLAVAHQRSQPLYWMYRLRN